MKVPKIATAPAALAPPVLLTEGAGKTARAYLLSGATARPVDLPEARAGLKRATEEARGALAGRWRLSITRTAEGLQVEAARKAGGLTLRVTASGTLGGRWRVAWSAERTARKGIDGDRKSGTAAGWEAGCSAAAAAAMQLEGAVCGERALLAGGKTARPAAVGRGMLAGATRPAPAPTPAAPAPAPKAKKSPTAAPGQAALFGR